MSSTTVRLAKGDSPNWGFRLQGGKDFGTPLVIQKVNGGSPAERAGLVAGDAVIRINNVDVYNLLHKEAQDVIVRAGHTFDMTIQRGGSTWRPSVVPVGPAKSTPHINDARPVTKTSLAARPGENIGAIGTGHNVAAKPFSPQVNGSVNGVPKLVNKQYNSPLKLYSEDAIAETISAQSEVLSTGALGVNFKKNEKNYDATNSAVYRMLQEAENEPRSPTGEEPDSGIVTAPNSGAAGLRHVAAPQTRPTAPKPQLPPGQNICADCERLIVGVFVRIKDKNLHVECFKCSTCGSSLKNVGYYNINNKLYCDVHAKAAARSNPTAALGGSPFTPAPPGAPANAISQALQSHSLAAPLSPKINSLGTSYQPTQNYSSAPKPFSSVSAPLSPGGTLPRAAPLSPASTLPRSPLSPVVAAPAPTYNSYSPASSAGRYSSLKPTSAPFKGLGGGRQSGGISVTPRRGRGVLNAASVGGSRVPLCGSCHSQIRFVCVCVNGVVVCCLWCVYFLFCMSFCVLFVFLEHGNEMFSSNNAADFSSVPVFNQISITIPYQSTSPHQLDSIGSSPKSDYSSYSETSTRDKIISEIKTLTPRLKNVNLSNSQSPRMNYVVNNVESIVRNDKKTVRSELLVPVRDYSDDKNSDLPDYMTYVNDKNEFNQSEVVRNSVLNSITKDSADASTKDKLKPICWQCNAEIHRGPFITALGKIWCPQHFVCATPSCRRPLQDIGFVEEKGQLHCEYCFEQYLAPPCSKCGSKIKGDCLKAIGKNFHPECFNCSYCGKLFGNNPFFLEDGSPYCEADWNEMFTTKCFACGFPVEAGDRWVEALNNNYHSQCFNCTMCKKNLEGQSFFAKGGRPFCKNHAR